MAASLIYIAKTAISKSVNLMRRLLPYLILVIAVPLMVFYGSGVIWSADLQFNATPDSPRTNWTVGDWVSGYAFNLTITTNGTAGNVWLLINITNATPIRNSAGLTAVMTVNNTVDQSVVNVTNASSTAVTISFNASTTMPGRYTGNLSISNVTNPNSKITTIAVTLDIPTTFNSTYFTSNNFFGIVNSTNGFDTFFINVSSAKALYVNINNSAADLLLFDPTGTLVAYNNTNSSYNKTILYPFPLNEGVYQLKVFYNGTNASAYNGIVMFSPLNSNSSFLDFGQVNTTSTISVFLNNTGLINLTAVVETERITKVARYTNLQNSTNISVPIANHYGSIDVMLEWNNASADFNLTVYNSSKYPVVNQSKRADMFNATGLGFDRIFSRAHAGINEYNNSWIVSITGDKWVRYNLTINLNVAQNWLNSSLGNYTRAYVFNATQNSTTVDFNLTIPALSSDGVYNGTITLYAGTGNYMSIPFGINVTVPMLMLNDSFSQKLLQITDNVGSNKTISYVFFLNNTGSYPLTLTDTNSTRLNNSANTLSFNYSFSSQISAANSTLFTLSINTTAMNTEEIVYYGWIKLNSTDAHPYNSLLINITLNLTNKLNTIIYSVANQTDKGVWITPINKTYNSTTITTTNPVFVNVTVNVTYQNNTFVGILNATNFVVWLQSEFPYEGSNYTLNFTNVTIATNITNMNQNMKEYVLNVAIPSTIPGGNYSVFVNAGENNSVTKNGGVGKFNYLYVNSSILAISLSNSSSYSDEFFATGTRDLNVTIMNMGAGNLANVSVKISASGSCTAPTTGYPDVYNIGDIAAFGSYSNATLWKINLASNDTCTVSVVGESPRGVWVLNDTTYTIAYRGTTASSGTSGTGSGSGSLVPALSLAISTDKATYLKGTAVSMAFGVTSGTAAISGASVKYSLNNPNAATVSSSSCTTNSTGQCIVTYTPASDATGTFTISANVTKDGYSTGTATKTFVTAGYSAIITNYAKSIYLLQGTSNSTTLTVNNNGVHTETITLTIKDIDGSWWNASKAGAALGVGESTDFAVNFNVPKDATVKNYTIAYSVSADTELDSEYAYLVVMPTEDTKLTISALLENYTMSLASLVTRLNVTQALAANNSDLRLAAEKINSAASLIATAKDHATSGDYVRANELAIQTKALMDVADALIKPVEMSQGNKRNANIIMVAAAIIVLSVVGIIAYMLLPEPGYSAQKGYTVPEHAGEAGKIKKYLRNIFRKAERAIESIRERIEELAAKKGDYGAQPRQTN